MKKWVVVVLMIVINLYGQMQPSEQFKQKFSKYYSNYNQFVTFIDFKISSPDFIQLMDTLGYQDYHYIFNIKWFNNGRFEFSYDSTILNIDKKKLALVLQELDTIKNQFSGISFDLQSLLMENPLEEIPLDAEYWAGGDTVAFQYTTMDQGTKITIRRIFLKSNGLFIKQLVGIGDKIIFVYPVYTEIDAKWTCIGWDTQIYQNKNIVGGFAIRFNLLKYNESIYLPEKIQYIVKVPEKLNEIFVSELFLYKFNVKMKDQ